MTTQTATVEASGLPTREGDPVRLRGVPVEATLRDYAARVVLEEERPDGECRVLAEKAREWLARAREGADLRLERAHTVVQP